VYDSLADKGLAFIVVERVDEGVVGVAAAE
jgi:hypothetical protein